MEKGHYTYMLRCADNTIYSGYAVDPIARLEKHNSGKGAKYTRGRTPAVLRYSENCENHSCVLRREFAVKRLTRAQKLELICTNQVNNPE
jgi:putative endonuclease